MPPYPCTCMPLPDEVSGGCRKEAWPFCRTSSSVRPCWELSVRLCWEQEVSAYVASTKNLKDLTEGALLTKEPNALFLAPSPSVRREDRRCEVREE